MELGKANFLQVNHKVALDQILLRTIFEHVLLPHFCVMAGLIQSRHKATEVPSPVMAFTNLT